MINELRLTLQLCNLHALSSAVSADEMQPLRLDLLDIFRIALPAMSMALPEELVAAVQLPYLRPFRFWLEDRWSQA